MPYNNSVKRYIKKWCWATLFFFVIAVGFVIGPANASNQGLLSIIAGTITAMIILYSLTQSIIKPIWAHHISK
jgi:hypothetical protein